MTESRHHARRSFLKAGLAAGCIAASTTGCDAAGDRKLVFGTLAEAMQEVARLSNAAALAPAATWSWSKTLLHCAQSIEYSMSGYPEMKSALFQRTAGAAAFSWFKSRGRMSHSLLEAIPGAPVLDANAATAVAVADLRKAVDSFERHTGELHPHFAYGALTKAEYEQAHAMHIANHLSGFEQKA